MDEISIFIDEIRTFKIVVLQSSSSEESLSLSEINKFKSLGYKSSLPNASINLYVVRRRSEPLLKELYNNARLSLTSLSKDDIQKAATQVLNFHIGDILKKTTFYSSEYISNKFDDNQRSELFASLEEFSKEGSIECDIFKDRPFISHDFFEALINDLVTKNSYSLRLMKDIAKVLKEKIIIEEKKNPHIFHIHENTLLDLLKDKIGIHDDIEESMPSETGQNKLNVSDSKIESGTEGVKNTPSKDNTKITPQIKSLFNFIEFLHTNIDNINQNMSVVLEWKKARWQERQFRQHYTEKLKMREVQKKIRAKEAEVSDQLIEPIKEKAIEIDVSILDNPKSIYTNFSHHIVMLQENFHQEDVEEIIKVKRQYIEIRNDINPHILLLLKDFFNYFDELMKHLVAFFKEDGDKTIPRILDIYLDDYFNTPVSFELPLTDVQIKNFYDSLLIKHQEVICEDTDFDYFSYAISGNEIPLEKTPFKPVRLVNTVDSMYRELLTFMKNHDIISEDTKTIPKKYRDLTEHLFLNSTGRPLKLRTPK